MRVKFWGVRGSLPSPLHSIQIKNKINDVLEKLTPNDLQSPEKRELFLSGLPYWLYGTVGGNTSCVTVQFKDCSELLVFDTGSGIREMGAAKFRVKPSRYHIFYSHFHWDHLMGFPFFIPAYNPSVEIDFYSPFPELEKNLHGQMKPPYFPIVMETMKSKKRFNIMTKPVELLGATVFYRKMNHPGDSYSFKVKYGKRSFIYATDTELSPNDFFKNDENAAFFSGVDLMVIDSQYTVGEAIEKYNWGHNSFNTAVDFAANWNIKHVVLFHHDPEYDDQKLYEIFQSARTYIERMNIKGIKISLAVEGMDITL